MKELYREYGHVPAVLEGQVAVKLTVTAKFCDRELVGLIECVVTDDSGLPMPGYVGARREFVDAKREVIDAKPWENREAHLIRMAISRFDAIKQDAINNPFMKNEVGR